MLALCSARSVGRVAHVQGSAARQSRSSATLIAGVLRAGRMSKSTFSVGAEGTATVEVTGANTAVTMGSGSLEVFATPSMVALMEKAACNAIASSLNASETTVGTKMDVAHVAATPVGCTATATAKLVGADGRTLNFEVTATDSSGSKIGEGTHTRAVVQIDKFMDRVNKKKPS